MANSNSKTKDFIDPTFLFRFEVDVQKADLEWTSKGLQLPETCRMPSFGALGGRKVFADVRLGWSEAGLGVHVLVNGKRQVPWCRETRLDESDGFHLWIDTRCSPNIHRATQYCHRFLFMPAGGGPRRERPIASLIEIHRARGNPKPIAPDALSIKTFARHDGYELRGLIPTAALTGFDPAEQSRLALYYAVIDRELGWQTLGAGPEYPVTEDPSLWADAVLN
ncbi:hypothetical protein Mal15_36470 [Stieleria maiorica]|uniref:Carbohydrate-binding domain-containing protein n=1 Tax=Stieleria maiorica TaxID=2795974 RepID=A0A5B9ME73_9BACT|nr:hypothetical protein [Stieleria maiorica]QEF99581.1 hypothetical protein Mal15_36470 [Stieleria maiorica]